MSSCLHQEEFAQPWQNLPSTIELLDALDESFRGNQHGQTPTSTLSRIRSRPPSFSSSSLRAVPSTLPYPMLMRWEQEENEDSSSVVSLAVDEQSRVSRTLHILNEALEIVNASDF